MRKARPLCQSPSKSGGKGVRGCGNENGGGVGVRVGGTATGV